jgi:hypothetical protein
MSRFIICFLLLFQTSIFGQIIKVKKAHNSNTYESLPRFIPYTTYEFTGSEIFEGINNIFSILLDKIDQEQIVVHPEKNYTNIDLSYDFIKLDYVQYKSFREQGAFVKHKKSSQMPAGKIIRNYSRSMIYDSQNQSHKLLTFKRFYLCLNQIGNQAIFLDVYHKFDNDSTFLGKIKFKPKSIKKPALFIDQDLQFKQIDILNLYTLNLNAGKKKKNVRSKSNLKKYKPGFSARHYMFKDLFIEQLEKDQGKSIFQDVRTQHLQHSQLGNRYNVVKYKISIVDKKRKYKYREVVHGNELSEDAIAEIRRIKKKVKLFIYAVDSSNEKRFRSESIILK